jgi:hypothetical protein
MRPYTLETKNLVKLYAQSVILGLSYPPPPPIGTTSIPFDWFNWYRVNGPAELGRTKPFPVSFGLNLNND